MDRRRLLITHRPSVRPTAAPREWWLYAYRLITGKNLDNGRTRVSVAELLKLSGSCAIELISVVLFTSCSYCFDT
jgi:hypothetical protein